ncbi:AmmeMemoRadiSam system protein A [Geotalea sp. SG265]|uniref:AmmeMemoRadiSam system protein A n=1 Tax=Geotalea sp. SG265 TaxID=2922867 RepID=UPI001FB01E27
MDSNLSAGDKQVLLKIARDTINQYVTDDTIPKFETADQGLLTQSGCFVSIKVHGTLRGCIGNFISEKPLFQLVQEMAISAATRDPRFYPMKEEDLADYNLEISVLSPLHKISSIEEIEVGKHGLYIEKNFSRGVLLPQVAVEFGWDRDTFLRQTCLKAGLKQEGWKEGTDIYIFSAQVFSEKDL